MLTIFYSPHMTSIDNEAERASGHADVPLSALGHRQAQELGQHYAAKAFDAVFSSDLQRASATSEIAFSASRVPVTMDARLREYDYGDMTQFPRSQVEEEFPKRITEPFPRGESLFMVAQRVGDFLRDALHEYDGQTIVVIGHRATRYGIEYWCGNASLEEIVHDPWDWRDIPIWKYSLDAHKLNKKLYQYVFDQTVSEQREEFITNQLVAFNQAHSTALSIEHADPAPLHLYLLDETGNILGA